MSFNRSGYIGRAPGDSAITIAKQYFQPTGVTTDFTFSSGYDPGLIDVYRNGIKLINVLDYAATDGSTISLSTPVGVGSTVQVVAYKAYNVATVKATELDTTVTGTNINLTGDLDVASLGTFVDINVSGGATVGGTIVANSFSGDGSSLTGVASTDNIITGTAATFRNTAVSAGVPNVNIVGLATVGIITAYGTAEITGILTTSADAYVGDALDIAKDIKVGAAATITGALSAGSVASSGAVSGTTGTFSGAVSGTTGTFSGAVSGTTGTFSGAVNVDATTDSTSSTSGALIVDGGLGVAKNVYIGAGLSVAGTLTYEDVTNVDSVGLITAKSGVNVSGGQVTIGTGITMGIAGVATFSGTSDVHLLDNVQLNIGDGSDLAIKHTGSHSYLTNSTGNLYITAKSDEDGIVVRADAAVELYNNNSKKFETSNDGTITSGIATATVGIDAAISVWTLGANSTNHYTFTGPGNLSATDDPTLNLKRGQKYTFKNRSGGHPFRIQSTPNGSAGTAYNTGVTNNDGGDGTNIIFDVPYNAPNVLYYQCTSHGNMGGAMYIDGSAYEISVGSGITFGSAGVSTFSGTADVHLLDNVQLNVGDASDLNIRHDGSNSKISHTGAGGLYIGADLFGLETGNHGERFILATANSSVEVNYNNSKKFETTNDGVVVTGICTATSFSGSGANLTGIDASPTVSGICTGSVAAHKAILVNSSGQFKTPTGQSASTGSEQLFENSDGSGKIQFLYMADLDKYALIYTDPDDSNRVWARVGTRSGTSFSYGTAAEIYNNNSDWLSADYMGGGKIIMGANPNGRISLLTVSGTSISEESGSSGTLTTYVSTFVVRAMSSTKAMVIYRRTYDNKTYAVVITRSSNSLSHGSALEVYGNISTENRMTAVYNPTRDKILLAFKHYANDGWYVKSLKYSGTTVVADTDTIALTGGNCSTSKDYPALAYDPVSTNIIFTVTGGSSGASKIFVLTQSAATSGTDIAFGDQGNTGLTWASNSYTVNDGCYGMSCDGQGNIFFAFKNQDDSYQTYGVHCTISSSTITLVSGPTELDDTGLTSGAYFEVTVARFSVDESPENIVFPFTYAKTTGGSQKSAVRVKLLAGTDLTAENMIGFSDSSGGSSGDTITVKVVGNTTTQSSLTPGQVYYVTNDGTLSTTAADPSVVAGRAISSTSLLIQPS